MTILFYLTIILFVILCALLSGVILIQESKSMGLGASFGGDTGDSLFGTSTADVLKKVTAWLAFIFLSFCLILSIWCAGIGRSKISIPLTIEQVAKEAKQ